MTTAILGLGNMGKGLAARLAGKTDLVLGARDTAAASEFAATLPGKVEVKNLAGAIGAADTIVLALPFDAALVIASTFADDLAGKILVDITNPLKADYSGLTIGHTTSAAEELQNAAPKARLVKAYNTIFAGLFAAPVSTTSGVPVFIAGNDEAAVDVVAGLVQTSGFLPEKSGTLDSARLIEPLGMLNIKFAFALGKGAGIAPAWVSVAA